MTLERISKKNLGFYAPRFEIEIKGQRLTGAMEKIILDLTVEEKVDEGASFSFTVHDEFDLKKQEFKWLDHDLFQVGNSITIRLGYGDNLSTLIMGNITGIEPSFFAGEMPTITVRGQDLSYDYLKRVSPEKTFIDMTYSDIARQIASEAGLQAVVDSTTIKTFKRKGNDVSYYEFLESLAGEIGFQFFIEGQTMYFVKPGDEKKEILTLSLGKDIISFRPSLRTTGLVTEVEVRGHNPRDPNKPIIGRARAGDERTQERGKTTGSQLSQKINGPVKKVITGVIVNSVEHANSIAKAELNRASDTLVEGEGECIGIPEIRAGVNINLERMGNRFSGKYYVKGTTHTINNSGYRTKFSVKRNAI